jgi:hypothetical protein
MEDLINQLRALQTQLGEFSYERYVQSAQAGPDTHEGYKHFGQSHAYGNAEMWLGTILDRFDS